MALPGGLSREGVHTARRVFGRVTRSIALGILIATTLTNTELNGWALAGGAVGIVVCGFLAWAFWRTTLENRLLPSLGLLAALLTIATVGQGVGFRIASLVLLCGCAINAIERLPLAYAMPATGVALCAFAAVNDDAWLTTAATTAGLALAGYVVRLDAEARGVRSGCWPRSVRHGWPRRSRRRSPSAPGSPGRSTTCSRTACPRSWCTSRRRGC